MIKNSVPFHVPLNYSTEFTSSLTYGAFPIVEYLVHIDIHIQHKQLIVYVLLILIRLGLSCWLGRGWRYYSKDDSDVSLYSVYPSPLANYESGADGWDFGCPWFRGRIEQEEGGGEGAFSPRPLNVASK